MAQFEFPFFGNDLRLLLETDGCDLSVVRMASMEGTLCQILLDFFRWEKGRNKEYHEGLNLTYFGLPDLKEFL